MKKMLRVLASAEQRLLGRTLAAYIAALSNLMANRLD